LNNTVTFDVGPAPTLSDADNHRARSWLATVVPTFRDLPLEAARAATAVLVAEQLAYGLLAGHSQSEILSSVLSRALTEKAEAAAIVDAMELGERATAKALGLAMQDVMSGSDATPTTAERLFLTPLQPADLAYLIGKCQEQEAALAPEYEAGRMLPSEAKKLERLRKRLAELVASRHGALPSV